ncbi:hypothetical protein GCM10009826_23540 [Humibacillus xanthopallidus]
MDPPGARHPLDLGRLPGVAGERGLTRHDGAGGAGDAEGSEASLVAVREGLLEVSLGRSGGYTRSGRSK